MSQSVTSGHLELCVPRHCNADAAPALWSSDQEPFQESTDKCASCYHTPIPCPQFSFAPGEKKKKKGFIIIQ